MGFSEERSDFVHVSGTLCGRDLSFLVDSGASHNFVSASQLQSLGVQPHDGQPVNVRLADNSLICTR